MLRLGWPRSDWDWGSQRNLAQVTSWALWMGLPLVTPGFLSKSLEFRAGRAVGMRWKH